MYKDICPFNSLFHSYNSYRYEKYKNICVHIYTLIFNIKDIHNIYMYI